MMRRAKLRMPLAIALLLVAAGCARRDGADAADVAPDAEMAVRLERGPCRGRCPVYTVQVSSAGRVRFDGRRFVADSGIHQATVPSAAVQALLDRVAATRFASTDSAITPEHVRCGRYMADLPWAAVSARVGGVMKTVRYDPGCAGAPKFLDSLATAVDSLARTSRWITKDAGANR
jgi:hypothetical protein